MALTAATTNGNDFITVTAAQLPGAVLDGLGGNDTLSLSGGGDFYLTWVDGRLGQQRGSRPLRQFRDGPGTAALDRIYLDAAQLQSLSLVDGGAGDRNFLF